MSYYRNQRWCFRAEVHDRRLILGVRRTYIECQAETARERSAVDPRTSLRHNQHPPAVVEFNHPILIPIYGPPEAATIGVPSIAVPLRRILSLFFHLLSSLSLSHSIVLRALLYACMLTAIPDDIWSGSPPMSNRRRWSARWRAPAAEYSPGPVKPSNGLAEVDISAAVCGSKLSSTKSLTSAKWLFVRSTATAAAAASAAGGAAASSECMVGGEELSVSRIAHDDRDDELEWQCYDCQSRERHAVHCRLVWSRRTDHPVRRMRCGDSGRRPPHHAGGRPCDAVAVLVMLRQMTCNRASMEPPRGHRLLYGIRSASLYRRRPINCRWQAATSRETSVTMTSPPNGTAVVCTHVPARTRGRLTDSRCTGASVQR